MKLKDTVIKNAKSMDKDYKLADGKGLYLFVAKSGGKSWRIDYAFQEKRKTFTIGQYPIISLSEARIQHLEFKAKLKLGIDPLAQKQAIEQTNKEDAENTFGNIALLWLEKKQHDKTPRHRQDVLSKLERYIYPTLKDRNIKDISAQDIFKLASKIEDKGLFETAKKTLGICNQIFSFAVGIGKTPFNVCAGLSTQLKKVKSQNFAHITDRKELGKLLKDIDMYPHNALIKIALQLAPLVFLRPSELINAKWEEINFDEQVWIIPQERMKLRKKHLVPLSRQVQALLMKLHTLTGDTPYLFASWNTGKPITIEGVRKGLIILGYNLTTHGFRHTASTLLNELGYNRDHIEKQLAHAGGDSVRGTYNHAEYLPERKKMLQEWADFLDGLKG